MILSSLLAFLGIRPRERTEADVEREITKLTRRFDPTFVFSDDEEHFARNEAILDRLDALEQELAAMRRQKGATSAAAPQVAA